jgi:glycerophosphoryl diester phosphodiesterase
LVVGAKNQPVVNREKKGFPIWIGHRGAMGHAPENTRASFETGLRLGADAVECDVRSSKDGRLVVIHDDRLDRTTTGRGPVSKKNWVALVDLDAGSWFSKSFAGERLWRLDDLLRWAKNRRTRSRKPLQVVVEIKAADRGSRPLADRVVEVLRRTGMVRRSFVISFNHAEAGRAKTRCPALRTGLLFSETPADLVRRMGETRANAIFPRHNIIDASLMAEARRQGWFVGTWTVNNKPEMKRLVALGVNAIATNFPDRAQSLDCLKEK